jgi:hypothetical protein
MVNYTHTVDLGVTRNMQVMYYSVNTYRFIGLVLLKRFDENRNRISVSSCKTICTFMLNPFCTQLVLLGVNQNINFYQLISSSLAIAITSYIVFVIRIEFK